ncbi:MAG TPA: M36 family metallopeptidase [Verrucomicrobiota bacterium]|nr:M36 family metallopeptidase [Verrucomicrobiota bacterium]
MKNRMIKALVAAWVLAGAGTGWAHVAPVNAPLPNVDVRKARLGETPALLLRPGVSLSAAPAGGVQAQAAALLQQRLPTAAVDRDPLLGTPRMVRATRGFLTGPAGRGAALSSEVLSAFPAEDRHRVLKAFVTEHAGLFGFGAEAFESAVVRRDYVDQHNGLRTVQYHQHLADIPVFEGVLQAHITAREELVRVSSRFLADPAGAAARGAYDWADLMVRPAVSAAAAVVRAAADVGTAVDEGQVMVVAAEEGAMRKHQARAAGLNGNSHVQLTWLPMDGDTLRLCWQVIFVSRARGEMYRTLVDAQTGQVLVRHNLTRYQAATNAVPATYRVFTSDSPSPFSPGWSEPSSAQPAVVPRTLLTNFVAISTVASPAGWLGPVNLNGAYETKGNNVDAHTDRNDDDLADTPRPGSLDLPPVFDFDLDLTQPPLMSTNASVVQLFYLNNFMHDKLYELGFTEAAGNFQNYNFNRGGEEGDAVQADGLDGADLNDYMHRNNANFYAPPDGIPGRMQMYIFDGPQPDRDGSFDAEVVCHEYTHGLTDRLVGGGTGITALQTAGMAEGWSDFYPLCLFSEATDDPAACYAAGGYATHMLYDMTENYYFGIRRYPYTVDMTKNPLTLKDIDPTQADPHLGIPISPIFFSYEEAPAEVHNQGEVWCSMLWEARYALVDALGWAEGNQTILQLVTDSLKLCPPNPTFVESRDAILEADLINYGGANRSELWIAFAKRGLGYTAQCPASDTTSGVVERYDLPPDVVISPPDGILELNVNPLNEATLLGGGAASLFVRVRDGSAVTNATVRGVVNGLTQVTFGNAGTPPDTRPRDSIYSVSINVPTTGTNLTLVVTATAPGKQDATIAVNYFVAIRPPNDLFANSSKVKAEGAVISANNRYAEGTLEGGEPVHAGASVATSSVWWSWTPTANSRALIDTGGSRFNTLLAVYTGSAVSQLTEVASAQTEPLKRKAYMFLDAKKGETYRIAVASTSTNNAGQITLSILPGGQADMTAPVVTVSKPVNGMIVNSNTVSVAAQAFDPGPISSGVDKITFLVSPRRSSIMGSGSSGSTNTVALTEGLNTITVTAVDRVGNMSEATEINVTYRRVLVDNDYFAFAASLTGLEGRVTGANAGASLETGEPKHAGNDGGRSIWWRWTAPEDGSLLLSTEGSPFDTLLGLYQGARVEALRTVASNDDAFDNSLFSKLQQGVRSNQTYYIGVDGFNGTTGIVQLAYAFSPGQLYTIDLQTTAGGKVAEHDPGLIDVLADSSQTLTAVPDTGYEFSGWEEAVISLDNPLSLPVRSNLTVRATFRPVLFTEDFETGGLTQQAWVTGGAKPWTVTTTSAAGGRYSAQAGAISHGQTSTLSLTGKFLAGEVVFRYRVSCETDWDYLSFHLDGQLMAKWSGDTDWQAFSVPIAEGSHTLEWRYQKDNQTSLGLDTAFLDSITAPLVPAPNDQAPAQLSVMVVPQGLVQLTLKGQTNQVYITQWTEEFPPGQKARWVPFSTNVADHGEVRLFVDPAAMAIPRVYFRAVLKP